MPFLPRLMLPLATTATAIRPAAQVPARHRHLLRPSTSSGQIFLSGPWNMSKEIYDFAVLLCCWMGMRSSWCRPARVRPEKIDTAISMIYSGALRYHLFSRTNHPRINMLIMEISLWAHRHPINSSNTSRISHSPSGK